MSSLDIFKPLRETYYLCAFENLCSSEKSASICGYWIIYVSYDAYGLMLGGNPSTSAATNLLFTGEQFDTNAQQYYLRARYYNPSNGRFNRMDPFAGNNQDPQSLHKYTYCHNSPVNNIDPTGMFIGGISGLCMTIMIASVITVTSLTIYNGIRHGASAGTIAWQVLQNLAAFTAILGVMFLSGPIALIAGATLALTFVVSLISIIRNWPSMDTTDRIILAATFVAFLAFAGAARASSPPKPAIQPGQTVSQLPEGYFTEFTVDMRGAPGARTNAAGFPRNAGWFWEQVLEAKPEYFSPENVARIKAPSPRSPKVDSTWIKYNPQHQSFMGETLIHHHIGQGPIATAVPEPIHQAWSGALHPNRGN